MESEGGSALSLASGCGPSSVLTSVSSQAEQANSTLNACSLLLAQRQRIQGPLGPLPCAWCAATWTAVWPAGKTPSLTCPAEQCSYPSGWRGTIHTPREGRGHRWLTILAVLGAGATLSAPARHSTPFPAFCELIWFYGCFLACLNFFR